MTIKEVAELAGVSTAAVSRYFNGGSLSDEKRDIIRKVVEENNFSPNSLAQTMRTGKSGQIGVIVPYIRSDSMSQIMEGIAEGLKANDYTFILACTDGEKEKEVMFIEAMQKTGMDGIILMGTVMTPRLRAAIDNSTIPVVVTGQSFKGVSSVYHDDVNCMKDITELMLKKRKRIAYLGVDEEDKAVGYSRRKGVEKAFAEAGVDTKELIIGKSDYTMDGGYKETMRLLKDHPDIDGIICATDRIAHGAILALRESGKKVPKDISVTGVGNSWADIVSQPQLTTVKLYFDDCGRIAVKILMAMIDSDDKDTPIRDMKLGYQIVERGSI